ncbi:BTB/POZ protein [Apiospora rasikravindrae]|uniref:BTB/POZ protein n=1 Tax=Apiospora rasikravindrae TaxID=990691 RepID=A0ABR1S2D9_9PEZI
MTDFPFLDEDPSIMMQDSGERLFKKELFSDAKLVVNGEVWPVHKTILCTRSEYFKKAFTGNFKEATTSEVVIEGHPTEAVEGVLYYLYTGVVDKEKFTTLRSAIDLFVAADYFDIDYASAEQSKYLIFFYAARLAYGSTPTFRALQSPIEGFLRNAHFLLTKETHFLKKLRDVPEFAVAIIEMMTSNATNDHISKWPAMPRDCDYCHRDVTDFADIWVVVVRDRPDSSYEGDLKLLGTCNNCTLR